MLAAFVISTPYAQHLISQILENPSIGYMEISALAGLGLYFLVGVLGSGVACFFYHYFEFHLGKNFDRLTNGLAWIHLLLTNIGVSSASLTMIYAGIYRGFGHFPKRNWRVWHDRNASIEFIESVYCPSWNNVVGCYYRCNLWRVRIYHHICQKIIY
jgi:hypothetical protein